MSRPLKASARRAQTRVAAFFSLRRRSIELVEPRERGVEVCLVEHLAAVDQVAFERH